MTDDLASARADLAFLRDLAEGDPRPKASLGLLLMAGGLFYGLETLIHWLGTSGLVGVPGWLHFAAAIFGTGGFLTVVVLVLIATRHEKNSAVTRRAYEAAFQATGLANLSMVCVFAYNAVRTGDFTIWLYYVPVVFALQGAAWFVAASLRRQLWYGAVAIGWFLGAVALGMSVDQPARFNLMASLSLIFLMALPGFVMWRLTLRAR